MKVTSQATLKDALYVARHMAPADRLEWSSVCPHGDPEADCIDAYMATQENPQRYKLRTLLTPWGEPLMLGGWDTLLGVAWFVIVAGAEKRPYILAKAIRECREEALKECPQLMNMVMLSNKVHVRLLESIGASFVGPIEPIGGEPFQMFVITRKEGEDV